MFVPPVSHCSVCDVDEAFSDGGMKPFKKMVYEDFQTGDFRWFEGGTLNVRDNCVDRLAVSAPDCTAIIYESNESTDVKRSLSKSYCR